MMSTWYSIKVNEIIVALVFKQVVSAWWLHPVNTGEVMAHLCMYLIILI